EDMRSGQMRLGNDCRWLITGHDCLRIAKSPALWPGSRKWESCGGGWRLLCRLFRRDGVRLIFLWIGRGRVCIVVFPVGEECRQMIRSGFGLAIDLGDSSVRRPQRLGQPARAGEQSLGLLGHFGLLQMVDELRGGLALSLPDRLEDARLRNAAE